jgi:hypothetical protein
VEDITDYTAGLFENRLGLGFRTSGAAYTDEDTETVLIGQIPANHRCSLYSSYFGGGPRRSGSAMLYRGGQYTLTATIVRTDRFSANYYYSMNTYFTPDFPFLTRIPVSKGSSEYYNVALPLRLVKDI